MQTAGIERYWLGMPVPHSGLLRCWDVGSWIPLPLEKGQAVPPVQSSLPGAWLSAGRAHCF